MKRDRWRVNIWFMFKRGVKISVPALLYCLWAFIGLNRPGPKLIWFEAVLRFLCVYLFKFSALIGILGKVLLEKRTCKKLMILSIYLGLMGSIFNDFFCWSIKFINPKSIASSSKLLFQLLNEPWHKQLPSYQRITPSTNENWLSPSLNRRSLVLLLDDETEQEKQAS